MKKHIPNLITLLNLLSGSIAAVCALNNQLLLAGIFICLGIFFDFFDGLAARVLDVKSDLGLQLDSLADMVTSGLVPGLIVFQLLEQYLPASSTILYSNWEDETFNLSFYAWSLFAFLIPLGSAYRLAKFNIDERQTSSFIGLPTPANALLILSLPFIIHYHPESWLATVTKLPLVLIGLCVFSAIILNAEIPLFALKFKNLNFKENWFRFLFVFACVLGIGFFQFLAVPCIILGYVLLSVFVRKSASA